MNEINKLNPLNQSQSTANSSQSARAGDEFAALLKSSIKELDTTQKQGEAAMVDIATGQVKDLHQAAIAINKAESSMKFMLEVRNKAINAYKEITRTQI